jgi:hypothetical protein
LRTRSERGRVVGVVEDVLAEIATEAAVSDAAANRPPNTVERQR